ncbi:MAG TPA: glycoside hydrolase family 38 C-terminal domain-containing protein [Acidimicrobiales bacterium]|nr:glycoside hydrolase family 38 C-terminal domain-containing protein [Acidimicrobiales bacterium]
MAATTDRTGRPAPQVLAIPNAHIDPVWIWDWREGMREVLATFEAAADRLDEYPDLSFAASSAAYYRWVEEMDPDLFERIRAHVAGGRWELVGGQWIEPDCNLPSGESVCRQLLYSQRYFHAAFGRTATVAYNIDSFGHAASLPQLFRQAGLDAYVMMRPQEHEKSLPGPLFRWRGVDGTELLTYRITEAYQTGLPRSARATIEAEQALLEGRADALLEAASQNATPEMFFVGVGDHGGGPTKVSIDKVHELAERTSGTVTFGSIAGYFRQVTGDPAAGVSLPVVDGDLHMHAVGCYSVVAWLKQANIQAETELVAAEKLASMCELLTGRRLEVRDSLRAAWEQVLFGQFHDSLGGTCTEEVCEDLRLLYGRARAVADDVSTRAVQLIARQADTWVEGTERAERNQSANPFVGHFPVPVVVFNPLAQPVRVPLVFPHDAASVAGAGGPLPCQAISSREGTRYPTHALTVADLPAFGFRVFWLSQEPSQAGPDEPARVGDDGLSAGNGRLDLDVDPAGGLVGVRAGGRQWLAEGLRPVVVDDPSDTWSHGVARYTGEEHECRLERVRTVETGPVRTVTRLTYSWGRSSIVEDLVVHAGLDELEVRLRIEWHERHQLLKLAVPLDVEAPTLACGVPYGTVARAADGREEVLHRWLQVVEPSGAGVVVSSDYGCAYDADGGRLRLTVLRSPRYSDHGARWVTDDPIAHPATDQGRHQVSYRFRWHSGPVDGDTGPRQADRHGGRWAQVTETWHHGRLGGDATAVSVHSAHVSLEACKRAEDGDGWVFRLRETAGQGADAAVGLPQGAAWSGTLRPLEVRTLLVPDDPGQPARTVPLTELGLPADDR